MCQSRALYRKPFYKDNKRKILSRSRGGHELKKTEIMEKEVPPVMEEENEAGLHTVDLGEGQQRPTLSFQPHQDEGEEDSVADRNGTDSDLQAAAATGDSESHETLEGTELHRRVRSSSAGANLKEWGMQQVKITRQV